MAKKTCPHCGADMIWITKVDKDGKATRYLICSRDGVCKLSRRAEELAQRRGPRD